MDRIAIDPLSVFGLPPVDYVNLVADLGCRHITLNLGPVSYRLPQYPDWSLRSDAALRQKVVATAHDRGVTIQGAEGVLIRPGQDVRELAGDLEAVRELGAIRFAATPLAKDHSQTFDQLAALTALADTYGLETVIEVGSRISLPTAREAVRHVGKPTFRLLLDTMHFFRLGWTLADLAAVDPALISYLQLCDVPLVSKFDDYFTEAISERLAPGAGELPLREFLQAAPRDVIVGLEIPMRGLAESGVGPYERLKPCVDGARKLLASLDQ